MLKPFVDLVTNENFIVVFKLLYYTSFIWLPALTIYIAWELWVRYVQAVNLAGQKFVLLEVKLPKDVFKSPQAAEFFINTLWQTIGESNWYEKYWKGGVRSWFSLEICAIDGGVHFFVWTKIGS